MKNFVLRALVSMTTAVWADTESTAEDGVSMSAINSHTCFTGNTGLEIEEDFSFTNFEYTISIWFKLAKLPWEGKKDFTLFSLVNSGDDELFCALSQRGELSCESGTDEVQIKGLGNFKTMITGTWHLLTLRSSFLTDKTELILSTHQEFNFKTDKAGYSLPNSVFLTFDGIRIGIERQKRNGFEGCLSRLQMHDTYLKEDSQIKSMGYQTLRPSATLIFQVPLTIQAGGLTFQNTAGLAKVLGTSIDIVQETSYDPSFDCTSPSTSYRVLEFDGETSFEVDLSNVSSTSTFSIWFWRYNEASDQTLISRGNEKFSASFDKDSFESMDLVINKKSIKLDLSQRFNMWLNLVVVFDGTTAYSYGIFDIEGTTLLSGSGTGTAVSSGVDDPLEIGDSFNGMIRGLLVTESKLTVEVQYDTEAEYQAAAKFGASLIKDNWTQGLNIKTFGSEGGTERVSQRKGKLSFRLVQFRESSSDTSGTAYDTDVAFDGVTCSETNQSLYFAKSAQKVQFDIETFNESPTLTFEIWMRAKNPFKTTGPIFSMSNIDSRGEFLATYMTIDVEGNQVVCIPFYSELRDARILFEDTSSSYDFWQHLSCSYSLESQTAAAHYFYDNKHHSYYTKIVSTEQKKYKYPQGVYRFCLNCVEGGKKRGQSLIYYKDLRLWYTQRTEEEIRMNRFQQVGLKPQLKQMVSYYKLMSPNNLNYANLTSPEINIDSDLTFADESRLTVCPLYTFHNQFNENKQEDYYKCYVDPISDLLVVIQYDKKLKFWVISAEFTFFVSDYASQNYKDFISWKWDVDTGLVEKDRATKIVEIVSKLQEKPKFLLPASLVTSTDNFQFNLHLFSTHGLFTTKTYQFNGIFDQECDVFDRTTGESFQQIEITEERGTKDQFLYVNITESENYYVKSKSDIKFRYALDTVQALQDDLNESEKSLRIRKKNQAGFPMNQFVRIVISIQFTSRKNSNVQFSKVMIYEVAFVNKVIPVVKAYTVQDSGFFQGEVLTETQTLQRNKVLRLDAQESYVTNWDATSKPPNMSFQWICPEKLQIYCNQEASQIELTDDMVRSAGFRNGNELTFTAKITSGVVQDRVGRTQQGSVSVKFYDIDLKVAFKMSPTPHHVKNFVAVTAFVEGYTTDFEDEQLEYIWTVTPEVLPENIASGFNSKQLVFKPNSLLEATTYSCKFSVRLKDTDVFFVKARTQNFITPLEIIARPIRIDFKSGLPFIKQFQIEAQETRENDQTQFFFKSVLTGSLVPLSGFQVFNLNTFLPYTKEIYARYFNKNKITNLSEVLQMGIDFTPADSENLYKEFYIKLDSIITTTSWEDSMVNVLKLAGSLGLSDQIIGSQRDGENLVVEYREDIFDNIDIILDSYPLASFSLPDNLDQFERANIIYMTFSAFRQITYPSIQFSMKNYQRALDKTYWLWENRQQEMQLIFTHSWFPLAAEDYLGFLSNLLGFVEQQSEEQKDYLDVSAFNEQYANATTQVRELVTRLEVLLAQQVPEGINFQLKVDQINIKIKTYSSVLSYTKQQGEFFDELSGSLVTFPIHRARKATDRVTVSVISFGMNPFFGSRYTGGENLFAVITPVAFSVNYRNDQQSLLGTPYLRKLLPDAALETKAFIEFEFKNTNFNKRYFNKDVSFCAPFDEQKKTFLPEECKYSFRLSKDQASCSCSHLSFFTLVEDYDDRKPPITPTFKDIPFVISSIYLIVFLLIGGLVFTINKDRSQKKEIEEANKAAFRNHRAVYTLNAIAFFRNDIALSLISKENQTEVKSKKLFQLYYQMLHPLSSLYFSFDPSLPKIFYFLVLYLRIMVIYTLSYAMFKDHTSVFYIDESQQTALAIIMSIVFSLLLVPLPFWVLSPCRNKHFLSRSSEDNDESSEEEEDSEEDEEEEAEQEEIEERASNRKSKKAELKANLKKLEAKTQNEVDYLEMKKVFVSLNLPLRLMFLINTNKTEDLISHKVVLPYASGDPEKVVDQIFDNNNKKEEVRDTEQELKKARDRIKKGKKGEVSDDEEEKSEVGPEDVEVDMEGGNEEQKEEKKEEESEEEDLKNKEVLQEAEVKKLIFRLLLFAVVFLYLLVVIAQAVSSEIGQQLYMESDWLYFYVFFGSQILGFVVVDSLAILFITIFMLRSKNEDRKRQLCIAKCCWQAFVWKSDYKFVLDLVKAKR